MLFNRYRHKIYLERPIYTTDSAGGQILTTWQRFGAPKCWIGTHTATESQDAGRLQDVARIVVCLEYRKDVTPEHRLVTTTGQIFNIRSVDEVNYRGREIEIVAERGVAV